MKKRLQSILSQYEHAKQSSLEEKGRLDQAKKKLDTLQQSQRVIQEVALSLQQQTHDQIASVVTKCLDSVFDDPYEFRIVFDRKRGKTEAKMMFVRDGVTLEDPLDESGHGPVEVASFALRLVCILLSQPQQSKIVLLDEPFKAVHFDNLDRCRDLMLRMSKDLGFQFIVITNIPKLQAGKIIEIEKK